MKNPIEDILNELGWDSDSFKIPVANEENKRLEEEIEQKTNLKAKLKNELECLENLIQTENNNVKRFENEYEQNKKLICAYAARAEMEKNLYNLAQSSKSKVIREIQEFDKNRKELNSKIDNLKDEVSKMKKRIEMKKQKIKQKHNYLLRCEEEIDKKEKRMELIEKVGMMDEKTYKDGERERLKAREDLELLRQIVTKTLSEIQEMEIVLENTTKLHSEALAEHIQLIRQWTQSTDFSKQRDKDIEEIMNEINNLNEISKQRKIEIEEMDDFLKHLISENKIVELNTIQAEKNLLQIREECDKCIQLNDACYTEVVVRKKAIRNIERNTELNRNSIKQKTFELEKKEEKLKDCNKKNIELNQKLGEISNRKTDVSYKTQQMKVTVENELKKEGEMVQKLKRLQNKILTSNNRVIELEDELKVVNLQESFEIKKNENLDVMQSKCEKVLISKKEEDNNFALEIYKHEKEIQKIMGHDGDLEQIERKRRRIEHLNQTYNDKLSESKRLHSQITILENNLRQITNDLTNGSERLDRVRSKKYDLILNMEGFEKQLKAAKTNTEDKQVEENILRLKVTKANKLLSKINDKVYDLEKYKLEIEALMQERRADIAIQKESLNLEKRLHATKLSELNNLIVERKTRIQQLQTRYYNYVSMFGNGDVDGEKQLQNTTYLKIQTAQEKFFLKEQGDQLDQAIRKCEYEIESMENTLKIINACNSKYKSNLAVVDNEGPEKMERNKLNDEMFNCMEKMKQHKKTLQEIQQNLEKMQKDYQSLLKNLEELNEEKEKKGENVTNLDKQILEQQSKISRANQSIRKLLKMIHSICTCNATDTVILQKKDIELKELDELNSLALQRLAEMMIRHVEAEGYVKKLLVEKNIQLPCAYHLKPSPISSRCGSSLMTLNELQNKHENGSKILSSRGSLNSSIVNIKPPW